MTKLYGPFSAGPGATFTEAQWQALHAVQPSGIVAGLNPFADSTGMQIKINPGSAIVQGFVFSDDAQETLVIATANPANPRVDRVVLRRDLGAHTIDFAVKVGSPGVTPAVPVLQRDASIWEMSLGQISIAANAVSISPGNVLDERLNPDVGGVLSTSLAGITECVSATRPTQGLVNGALIFEMDTGFMRYWYSGAWSAPLVTGTGAMSSPTITGTVAGAANYTNPQMVGLRLASPTYLRISANMDIGQAVAQVGTVRWLKAWGANCNIACSGSIGFLGANAILGTWTIVAGDAQTFIATGDNYWDAI